MSILCAKKVAVIVSHPDDEVLGCGATVRGLSLTGSEVRVLILGEGLMARKGPESPDTDMRTHLDMLKQNCRDANRALGVNQVEFRDFPDNRFDSISLLDIVQTVEAFLRDFAPVAIFTHHRGDLNMDHMLTSRAVLTACRPSVPWSPEVILGINILSSTDWYFGSRETAFYPNYFVDISSTLEDKVRAMSCYASETAAFPFARSLDAIRYQAKYYGSIANLEAAEAFEIIRAIHR